MTYRSRRLVIKLSSRSHAVQLYEWLNAKFESNNICSIYVSILTKDLKRALSKKMKITGLYAVISHLFAGWGHVGDTTRGCSFLQQKWWIQTWQREPGRWPLSWKSGHCHHTRDHDMMLTDLQTAQNCTATELSISQESVLSVIHKHLQVTKVSTHWVLMKSRFGREQSCHFWGRSSEISSPICNQRWDLGPLLQTKRKNNRNWESQAPWKVKSVRSAGKVIASIFFDAKRVLQVE